MINTATQIIKDCLIDGMLLEWSGDGLNQFDSMELLDLCEQYAYDNSECYDEEWYPIMEVKNAKMSVDWLYLAEYHNDRRVDDEIEFIFSDYNN